MPYAMNRLPYGLRCRLQELSSPTESYFTQIAAPDFFGPRYIQKVEFLSTVECIDFTINPDSQLYAYSLGTERLEVPENGLQKVVGSVCIKNFLPDSSPKIILDHYVLEPTKLTIHYCSAAFIRNLAAKIYTPLSVLAFNDCKFEADNVAATVKAFEQTRELQLSGCPLTNNWVNSFNAEKITGLQKFTVHGATPESLNVEKDALIQFLKAQQKTFCLNLNIARSANDMRVNNLVAKLFDKSFNYSFGVPPKEQIRGMVRVSFKYEEKYFELRMLE